MHPRFHIWQEKRLRGGLTGYATAGITPAGGMLTWWVSYRLFPVMTSPKNPRVLVGERHCRPLPAAAFAQSLHPLRDGIIVVLANQHDRLGTLYQQGSQVVAAQAGLAAAGILFRCQPQPGTELGTVFDQLLHHPLLMRDHDQTRGQHL